MDGTKTLNAGGQAWFWLGAASLLSLTFFLLLYVWPPSHEEMHQEHQEHHHMSMSMPMHEEMMTPAMQAKRLADKKESEFNHHLAGFFVVLAGAFILLQNSLASRWPSVKYVWPACFLLSGIFLMVWSDTELWPFGHREWLEALRNNREVLQHKVFAVLLLILGVIEWQRARGVLKAFWSGLVFPVLAIGGSVLLLFHQHEAGMHGSHQMEVMAQIQSEHLSYTVTGLGIGLAKGLAEIRTRFQGVFAKLWPALTMLLGVLLMLYQE
jgi:putative copper resistance protein D